MASSIESSSRQVSIAQSCYKDALGCVFEFVSDRAVCYRVCKAWLKACETSHSRNMLDFRLTAKGQFTWDRPTNYLNSIFAGACPTRLRETAEERDSTSQIAEKYARVVRRAESSIRDLNLDVDFPGSATKQLAFGILFSPDAPARFLYIEKFSLDLTAMPLDQATKRNLLRHMPRLKELSLDNATVADVISIAGETPHEELRTLNVKLRDQDCNFSRSPSCITALLRLEKIRLQANSLNDEQLNELASSLQGCKVQSIRLSHCPFDSSEPTDIGIANVLQLRSLTEISLAGLEHITDSSMQSIAQLTMLIILKIFDCDRITHEGICALGRSRTLTSLTLYDWHFRQFPPISRIFTLQMFEMNNFLGVPNLEEIINCIALHTLKFSLSNALYGLLGHPLSDEQKIYLRSQSRSLKSIEE